jgi:hypothetical protein
MLVMVLIMGESCRDMTDHSTTSHLSLDHESILKAHFKAIDEAPEIEKKLQGSTRLSFHLERIKHLAVKTGK